MERDSTKSPCSSRPCLRINPRTSTSPGAARTSYRDTFVSMIRSILALALLAVCVGLAAAADKPNIIVILLDDLGYSDLSCYGGEIDTPNIDALAENGVRFESFYNSARCCPSRASLMTGLYPPQTGVASFTTRQPHPTRARLTSGGSTTAVSRSAKSWVTRV